MMAGGDLYYGQGSETRSRPWPKFFGDTSMKTWVLLSRIRRQAEVEEPEQNVVDRFAGTGPIGTAVKGVLQSLGFN